MVMRDWFYNIGQNIVDDKRNLTITDREIRTASNNTNLWRLKWYKYTCNMCGWEGGWIKEGNLKKGNGCKCCAGKEVVFGINDVYTLYPEKRQYFVDINDAKNNTKNSHAIVKTKCPYCGDQKDMMIYNLIYQPYSCSRCGDNISIPEKFVYAVLRECKVDFIRQLSSKHFDWCGQYRYDFYLNKEKIVMEVNGLQHYQKGKTSFGSVSYEEIKKNDINKVKNLFGRDDVKYYITIDARRSSEEYLTNQIKLSDLWYFIDVNPNDIDFKKCYEYAIRSQISEVCNIYENNKGISLIEIAEMTHLGISTVSRYIKLGNDLGLCTYNGYEQRKEQVKKTGYNNAKPVKIISPDGTEYIFDSTTEASNRSLELFGVKLHQSNINACCRGIYKQVKGYKCVRIEKGEKENGTD